MKARRKKPGARGAAARKPAASRKRSANAAAKHVATALAADCTIENAPGLHQRLAKSLADRACVTLDFTAVMRCDTAGMQLLAAFIRERREAGRKVALKGMSDNFITTARLLGLEAVFETAGDESPASAGHA